MALFHNRPLALASVGLVFAALLSFFFTWPWILAVFSVLSVALLALLVGVLLRGMRFWRLALLLLVAMALLGCFRVAIFRTRTERCWEERKETRVTAELSVREVLYHSAYGTELLVTVRELDGERVRTTAVLRSEEPLPFYVGDRLCGSFEVKPTDYEVPYRGATQSYLASGAHALLLCDESADMALITSGTNGLRARIADLRAYLSYRITEHAEGEEGALLSAMLLGDRDELSAQTVRLFSETGLSHLLALSGLHLAILVAILDRVLFWLYAGKRLRMAVILPFCLAYFVLTGCQISMLRAIFMLALVYLAFLLGGDYDGITALCFGAALMVLSDPHVLFDTSFQLTMLATLGLLCVTGLQTFVKGLLPTCRGVRGALVRGIGWVISTLIVTFGACMLALPVQWLTFGEVSAITPISSVLAIPQAPVLMLAAFLLLLCPCPFLGKAATILARLLLGTVEHLSQSDALVSLRYSFVPYILIPVALLTILLLVLDLKRLAPLIAAPALIGTLVFAVCLGVWRAEHAAHTEVLLIADGAQESIALMEADDAVLCVAGDISLSKLRQSWQEIEERAATGLDALLLTDYEESSVRVLARFSEEVRVGCLLLPEPETEEEEELFALIVARLARDTRCETYTYGSPITFFDENRIRVSRPLYEERSVRPALAISVARGKEELCYHAAALSEYERHADSSHVCMADTVLLGRYGPVPHEEIALHHVPDEVCVRDDGLLGITKRYDTTYRIYSDGHVFVLK